MEINPIAGGRNQPTSHWAVGLLMSGIVGVALSVMILCSAPRASAQGLVPSASPSTTPAPSETVVAPETVAATATETAFRAAVSRAYMNCLRDLDESIAELAHIPKARDSEERAMKKFCESRRESCLAQGNDEQCRLFTEDYSH